MPKYTTPPSLGIFSEFEVLEFIKYNDFSLRNQALIALLWLTGARIQEILNLTKEDIIIDEDYIKIRLQTLKKRRKENENKFMISHRIVEFSKKNNNKVIALCLDILEQYYNQADFKLFKIKQRQARNIINKTTQETIQKRLAPHHFRHSRFTFLAEKNIPINLLLHLKGSSDLRSIVPYLQAKHILLKE